MAKANDAQNPSMEQILQTIRGVISGEENTTGQADNDDVLELTEMVGEDGAITSLKKDAAPQAENTAMATPEPNTAAPDVLANIDNALESPQPVDAPSAPAASEAPSTQVPNEHEDDEIAAEPPTPPAPVESAIPEPANMLPPEAAEQNAPISENIDGHEHKKSHLISDATAAASTKALAALLHNLPKPKVDTPSFQSGLTLEALVVEALKPELSAWLDKNLPILVTHIVEKEIKKLLPQPEE